LRALKYFHDEKGMKIHGHTLVWPSFGNMEGLAPLKDDPAKLGAAIDAHIRELGSKTASFCETWDVVNEPYGNQEITRILGPDSIARWFRVARETMPKTKLYINEGITPGSGGATEAYYYDVCKQLVAQGAPVDGIGLQSHIGGSPTDIKKMWDAMNKFAALKPGMELAVSEFDINFQGDTQLEGDFTRDFTTLVFSHPAMKRFTMWGFYGDYHWLKYAPIFDNDGSLRPSGKAWTDLVLKQWWTNVNGKSNAQGKYATRGFLGDYDITVTSGGKSKTVKTSLPKAGQTLKIVLD
jgi:GH35 family endo-1,4-beta-xylanase